MFSWLPDSHIINVNSTSDPTDSNLNTVIHSQKYIKPPPKPIVLFDPNFPLLPFIRACYMSDHMKARRRRWSIIKQFDVLWTNYRRDGWERNEFTGEDVAWGMVNGRYTCDCNSRLG